jgi:hypothetical protein
MTLEKVLGDVDSWCWLYLAAKSSHVGVDVDGLAYPAPSYGLQPSDEGIGPPAATSFLTRRYVLPPPKAMLSVVLIPSWGRRWNWVDKW